MENSVWVCRWTNESLDARVIAVSNERRYGP